MVEGFHPIRFYSLVLSFHIEIICPSRSTLIGIQEYFTIVMPSISACCLCLGVYSFLSSINADIRCGTKLHADGSKETHLYILLWSIVSILIFSSSVLGRYTRSPGDKRNKSLMFVGRTGSPFCGHELVRYFIMCSFHLLLNCF